MSNCSPKYDFAWLSSPVLLLRLNLVNVNIELMPRQGTCKISWFYLNKYINIYATQLDTCGNTITGLKTNLSICAQLNFQLKKFSNG